MNLEHDNANLFDELEIAKETNEIQSHEIFDLKNKYYEIDSQGINDKQHKSSLSITKNDKQRESNAILTVHSQRQPKSLAPTSQAQPEQKSQFGFGMISSVFSTISNVINQQDQDDEYEDDDMNEYMDKPHESSTKFNPNKTQKLHKIQEDEDSEEGIAFPTAQNPTQKPTTDVFEIDEGVDLDGGWGDVNEIEIDIEDNNEEPLVEPKKADVWGSPDKQIDADELSDDIFNNFDDVPKSLKSNIVQPKEEISKTQV